jgi:ClpP class serine protease
MQYCAGLVAVVLILASARASDAAVRIADDPGGRIGKYVEMYERLRASRQTVIIDGLCASACTIVLSEIPANRICVTSQAKLAFHAAWDFGRRGQPVVNPGATRMLYS